MGVRLTPDEQWTTLEAAHTGIFTSLRRDGAPVALPVWFAVVDRKIYFRTPTRAKKVLRVRHDDRCSCLVESGLAWKELKAVHCGDAVRFDQLTFEDAIARDLKVMDLAALALCREHAMKVIVYDMNATDALTRIVRGDTVGTVIEAGDG